MEVPSPSFPREMPAFLFWSYLGRLKPGTLKITVCPPDNAKKMQFPRQSHPHMLPVVRRIYLGGAGRGAVLGKGVVSGVFGGGGVEGFECLREPLPKPSSEVSCVF